MTRNIKEFVNQNTITSAGALEHSNEHICVLLAHYNGAATLLEQLESLADQTHRDWSLVISDDGSRDGWLEIASRFSRMKARGRSWLISGPRQGFAQNFFTLAKAAGPSVPYVAFCDQDDVWMRDKLARALRHLKEIPAGKPALYCSRTVVCDAQLQPRRPSPLFKQPPSFRNALVQNIGGGNTMLLNRAALDLLQDTIKHARGVISHDWWIYQLVTGAGGTVIYDTEPSLFYRQHGGNVVGANDTFLAMALRILALFQGRFQEWNSANIAALEKSKHWLTPDARCVLEKFVSTRQGSLRKRLRALRASGVYRQTRRGTLALWLAVLANRL